MEHLAPSSPPGRYEINTEAGEALTVIIYPGHTTAVGRGLTEGSPAPTLRSDGRIRLARTFSFVLGQPGSVRWLPDKGGFYEAATLTGRVVSIRRVDW